MLKETTVILPFHGTKIERILNLQTTCQHLSLNGLKVIVGATIGTKVTSERKNVRVVNLPYENFFYAKILNDCARFVDTTYMVLSDGDVIIPRPQMEQCVKFVSEGTYDYCSGYDGRLINIPRDQYNPDHKVMSSIQGKVELYDNIYVNLGLEASAPFKHKGAVGGFMLCKTSTFFECGMENEQFKYYSCIDNERIDRIIKLGKRYGQVPGIMYHLKHQVTHWNSTKEEKLQMRELFQKLHLTSKEELQKQISEWSWVAKKTPVML